MINICEAIQCPEMGKKCNLYRSANSCHLQNFINFPESKKWLFLENPAKDMIQIIKETNEKFFLNDLPLQSWWVHETDRFVYDKVNGINLETQDVFTDELIESHNIEKLIPHAIDLTNLIMDFQFNNLGVLVKQYQLGETVVRCESYGTGIKIRFEPIKNIELLRRTCIVACDLLGYEYSDCLDLEYWKIRP